MVRLKLSLSGSDAVLRNFKRPMAHSLARPDVFDYYLIKERKKNPCFVLLPLRHNTSSIKDPVRATFSSFFHFYALIRLVAVWLTSVTTESFFHKKA